MLTTSQVTQQLLDQRLPLMAFLHAVTRNYHLAEDVFQETFVKAVGKSDGFESADHLTNWFRTVGRNRAIDLIRTREGRYVGLSTEALDFLEREWASQCRGVKQSGKLLECLETCMQELSERNQGLLRMRYFENRSGADIAAIMQRKIESAYQAISRLHGKLADCIRNRMELES